MEVTCSKCKYNWDYKGKSAFHATCPKCQKKNSVTIWENLKYAKFAKCLHCGQRFPKKKKRSIYCSLICMNRANASKGGNAILAKNGFKGKNNPNWKGGVTKDNYRYKKRQVERFPKRVKAREILHKAKLKGQVTAPLACENCHNKTNLYAHHEDYDKPLDVIWLCRPCHRKIHNGLR
jgi:Zn ribbon nucleic-acid-binding protein